MCNLLISLIFFVSDPIESNNNVYNYELEIVVYKLQLFF